MPKKELETLDTEKEEFELSLKDANLIAQIDEWERDSESFYESLRRIWRENLDYYRGKQTGVEKITGRLSKAVENRIWMACETMIPIVTARLPDIVVSTDDADEQSQVDAHDLQDVLGYEFERIGLQALGERFVRDLLIKRYGVFKVSWDNTIDDVEVRVIDPRRIRIPAYGKTVDDLLYIIEELEMSYASLEEFFGKKFADEVKKQGRSTDENKVREKNFIVQEVWTNDLVVWRCGSVILKKQKNPHFSYSNLDRNFFLKAKKPYVIKSLFETDESIIGTTDYVQQTIPIQDNINIRKRQIEDIANKVSNPILLIDSDVMSEEEAANITNEPGLILYGKDAANGTKIRFENPGQVPQYLFQDLQFSRSEFDNIWGMHSTTRGEREGRETFRGRQLLRQGDLGRVDLIARQLERALDEIAEHMTQLIKLFMTEKRTFSILGATGIRFIKSFSGESIGNVRPMVMAGSTLPKDEISIRDEAIQLWGLKAIGIETLYKALKVPNLSDAVADYVKTQSGAILQQGAQPVGGTAPQSGEMA